VAVKQNMDVYSCDYLINMFVVTNCLLKEQSHEILKHFVGLENLFIDAFLLGIDALFLSLASVLFQI
jgi:hypothetical protein